MLGHGVKLISVVNKSSIAICKGLAGEEHQADTGIHGQGLLEMRAARFESTSWIPILAKITVSAANIA